MLVFTLSGTPAPFWRHMDRPPRPGCPCIIEVAGLWEGEAESTNAPAPNTYMHTGTHIHMHMRTPMYSQVHTHAHQWDLSLLESLH